MKPRHYNVGFLELLISFFIWSSWIIPARLLGENLFALPFFLSLFVSIGWGAILLARSRQKLIVEKADLMRLFLLAIFFQINMITYLAALKYTDAAIAVLTHYTAPIFVAILAPVILKEKITGRILVSLLMAITGFVIIFFKISSVGPHFWLGTLLGLASGLFYALIIMLAKDLLNRVTGEVILFYQNFFGVFLLLLFIPLSSFKIDSASYWKILLAAVLYPGFASYLYMRGLKKVESVKASIVGYLEPLGTITWGWIFFSEQITIRTVIGGFFILYSGYYVTKQEKTGTGD
jgi:drug/metabolite transporter (DMT)-like permease